MELSDTFTPVAGRLLAELGADVLVVEPPTGSPQRRRPPFAQDVPDLNRSLRWWGGNVGKRGVVVDMSSAREVGRLRGLLVGADVVIEGAGLGLDPLGLGFESLSRTTPSLIWLSVTPFGRQSHRSTEPVTDLTMLAGGGPVWNCGYDDHTVPPMRGAGDQSVNIAGQYGAIAVLVALAYRDRSGRGQLIDLNVNAACNVTNEQVTYNWLVIRETCTRQTGRHAYYHPTAPVQVRCADGLYATTGVLPRRPDEFEDLHQWLSELGLLDDLPDAVFLKMAADRDEPITLAVAGEDVEATAMMAAARDAISLIAANLPAKEFFLQSQARGFPAGAILSPEEAFEDEHSAERGFRVTVSHPELGKSYEYPGLPYSFSSTPSASPRRPPMLGEHNGEVLGSD